MGRRTLDPTHAGVLLDLAQDAILDELVGRRAGRPDPGRDDPVLRECRSVFVTLRRARDLWGCIGRLTTDEPLVTVVPKVARDAAFRDPRFAPLRIEQFHDVDLELELSVLSTRTPLAAGTRAHLMGRLRPGADGLVLADGVRRALFLPDVWDNLPRPDDFVDHLLRKAGLPADRWPSTMQAWRFTTEAFARAVRDRGGPPRDLTR